MKKIVPFLVALWLFIGLFSLFIWFKVGRILSPELLEQKVSGIQKELKIPWDLSIEKTQYEYKETFSIILLNVEFSTQNKKVVVFPKIELKIPYLFFLTPQPQLINVMISDAKLLNRELFVKQIENYFDERRKDSVIQVSLPRQFLKSKYNLRFSNFEISKSQDYQSLVFKKLNFFNFDTQKPSAFEAVLDWKVTLAKILFSGESKIVGEYKLLQDKIDLHFHMQNKIMDWLGGERGGIDLNLEGRGFYHPRLGFYSTLSSKEEWCSFLANIESAHHDYKIDVKKFILNQTVFFDLSPFSYREVFRDSLEKFEPFLIGQLNVTKKNNQVDVQSKFVTSTNISDDGFLSKNQPKEQSQNNPMANLGPNIELDWGAKRRVFIIRNGEKPLFSITALTDDKFQIINNFDFKKPLLDLFTGHFFLKSSDLILLEWLSLTTKKEFSVQLQNQRYELTLKDSHWKISNFLFNDFPQPLALLVSKDDYLTKEVVVPMEEAKMKSFFSAFQIEPFFLPEVLVSGGIYMKDPHKKENFSAKYSWKGSLLDVLSFSSCRVNFTPKMKDEFSKLVYSQLELDYSLGVYTVKNWKVKNHPTIEKISGSWSNNPIFCDLKFSQSFRKKEKILFELKL
jgi:hypothetical protein